MTDTTRTLEEVTAVQEAGESAYVAELDPGWTVGGKPNGGYLQVVMARAACAVAAHPHVIAASTHYLRAPSPGKARLDVELLRAGRSASQVRVRMSQDDQPAVETVFGLADLADAGSEPQWGSPYLPEPGLPFEECVRMRPPLETVPVQLFHQLEIRLEPDSLAAVAGSPRGLGELRGWVALPGDAPFDPTSLLLAADVFPPATFDIKVTGWVPTLELSTYVRALPAPGPVEVLMRANLVHGDRVDETVTLRDTTGRIVAQSHQLAAIRFGD